MPNTSDAGLRGQRLTADNMEDLIDKLNFLSLL